MSTEPKRPNEARRPRAIWLAAPLLLVLAGAGILLAYLTSRGEAGVSDQATFLVQRKPLMIKISGAGTINPVDRVVVKCQVEGVSTILEMVDQGVEVQANDILVKLDSSQLEDTILSQEITAQNGQASFTRAKENLAVTLSQNKSDIARAELDLQFARQNHRKYIEGEYPQELQRAEADITLAKVELSRAEDKLFYSRQLHEKGFITRTELQADELSVTRAQLDLKLAEGKLSLLKDYTYKQQVDQLTSDITQAEMALDRVKAKANADEVQARADLQARELELRRQEDRLTKLRGQLANCVIRAPEAGKVVYANTGEGSWRRQPQALEKGSQVREGQELIHLPRPGGMKAVISVHETSIGKLREAQARSDRALPVRITVEAQDSAVYWGWVANVSPMPQQTSWLRPDVKVYDVTVNLTGDTSKLITGNTCRADIIIDQYDNALFVPVQSVVREGDKSMVYLPAGAKLASRQVQTGLSDNEFVVIEEGLREGERVALSPPLDKAGSATGEQSAPEAVPETPTATKTAQPAETGDDAMTFEKFKAMDRDQKRQWMQSAGREKVTAFFQGLTPEQQSELRSSMGGGRCPGGDGGRPEGGGEGGRGEGRPERRPRDGGQQ